MSNIDNFSKYLDKPKIALAFKHFSTKNIFGYLFQDYSFSTKVVAYRRNCPITKNNAILGLDSQRIGEMNKHMIENYRL